MALTKVTGSVIKDSVSLSGNVSVGGTLTYQDVTNVDALGIGTFRTGIKVLAGQLDVGSNIKLGNAGVITATSFVGSGANLTGIDATKIITGNTQVQTIDTGSDGHVKVITEGSERLRIDASGRLLLGTTTEGAADADDFTIGTSTNSAGITIRTNTSGTGRLWFSDGTSGDAEYQGYIQYDHNNQILSLGSGGSTRLQITSTGRLKIGSSTATGEACQLTLTHTNNSGVGLIDIDAYGSATLQIRSNWSGSTINGMPNESFGFGTPHAYPLVFTTSGTERLRIDAGGGLQLGTSTATASKLTVYGASDAAAIFQGSSTGTGAGNGLLVGNNGGTTGLLWNYENGPVKIAAQNAERVRIETDGSCYFGPQIITEADMNWGHDAHQRPFVFSGNQAGVNPADATIVVANPNTNPASTRLGSFMFGCKTSSGGNSGIKAYIEGWTTSNPSNAYEAGGYIKFVTRQSAGSLTEHFKIDHDGKLYKSGNHFYPLVNYSEYATYGAVSVTSGSYTDLRTLVSGYTPKKAGNLIVIHHQSQCWQGGDANSSGDAMWRIQRQEGGGSWTTVIENRRIMGNMDGRNYTGGSGLSRHHRTVHLMGSFECAGTSINFKSQGEVDFTSPGLQWYHHSHNIFQIWEYEKG